MLLSPLSPSTSIISPTMLHSLSFQTHAGGSICSSSTCSSCPMQILGRGLEIGRSGPLTTRLSRGPGTVISSGSELSTGLRCSSQDLLTSRYLGHRRLREPYCITCMTPSGISRIFFIVTYTCDFTTSLGLSKGHKNVKVCILLRRLLPSVGNTLSPSNHTKAFRERTKHIIVSASMSYEHPQQFPFPFSSLWSCVC